MSTAAVRPGLAVTWTTGRVRRVLYVRDGEVGWECGRRVGVCTLAHFAKHARPCYNGHAPGSRERPRGEPTT